MKLVVLNPTAGGGRARARWERVGDAVRDRLGPHAVVQAGNPNELRRVVQEAADYGVREFVAAGGDGTVNLVVSSLAQVLPLEELAEVTLGAVGLGSSNDYHKPIRPDARLQGVPMRLDFAAARPSDLCFAEAGNGTGTCRRYWVLNGSAGITAEANHLFNYPDALLTVLKRFSTGLSIAYAAIRTVLGFQGRPMQLVTNGGVHFSGTFRNVAVLKNPHVSGSLRYPSPFDPASGRLEVHVLHDVGLLKTLATLAGLARGRFEPAPCRHSFAARDVTLSAAGPFALELDGEVTRTSQVRFGVLPGGIRLCP